MPPTTHSVSSAKPDGRSFDLVAEAREDADADHVGHGERGRSRGRDRCGRRPAIPRLPLPELPVVMTGVVRRTSVRQQAPGIGSGASGYRSAVRPRFGHDSGLAGHGTASAGRQAATCRRGAELAA